ncbi:hypothetical protein BLNAU_11215 [Blattamonas nauphoetae]|uniref:Uncharacterized protein n=1 Tax=Blattamonas nauphoetae TaxID=2049346 RepID=A0ABQ9XN32_9EUKA|nr:hypothetical protein BLNAU_11215 [Blattamonas nauphoetae]
MRRTPPPMMAEENTGITIFGCSGMTDIDSSLLFFQKFLSYHFQNIPERMPLKLCGERKKLPFPKGHMQDTPVVADQEEIDPVIESESVSILMDPQSAVVSSKTRCRSFTSTAVVFLPVVEYNR